MNGRFSVNPSARLSLMFDVWRLYSVEWVFFCVCGFQSFCVLRQRLRWFVGRCLCWSLWFLPTALPSPNFSRGVWSEVVLLRSEYKLVVGCRWKCVNCADYDICGGCENLYLIVKQHNIYHTFLKLHYPLASGVNVRLFSSPPIRTIFILKIFAIPAIFTIRRSLSSLTPKLSKSPRGRSAIFLICTPTIWKTKQKEATRRKKLLWSEEPRTRTRSKARKLILRIC